MIRRLETLNVSWKFWLQRAGLSICETTERKHTLAHTHVQNYFTNHRVSIWVWTQGFHIFPFFFLVLCNWLTSWCSGRQQAQQRLPSRPIDLSSAHRVKAEGMRERHDRQPLFLWQPTGACLGLFPVSSDCFSFSQGAALCRSEEVRWSVPDI